MDQNLVLTQFEKPLVAIACVDSNNKVHYFYPEEEVIFSDIQYGQGSIIIGNVKVMLSWFEKVFLCTDEILERVRETLENA